MKSSLKSPRKDPIIPLPAVRSLAILSGSATQIKTNRNSSGAWIHDVANNRLTITHPPISEASINVLPRSKNPINPPANNEKAASKRLRVASRIGGSHRTLAIIAGYRKESNTGTQLFKKTSSVTAVPPRVVAARRGAMARDVSKNAMNLPNVVKKAISTAPAKEPRAKASSVAPNARSMNFMAKSTISAPLYQGA